MDNLPDRAISAGAQVVWPGGLLEGEPYRVEDWRRGGWICQAGWKVHAGEEFESVLHIPLMIVASLSLT